MERKKKNKQKEKVDDSKTVPNISEWNLMVM